MNHITLSFLGTFQATVAGKPITNFRSSKIQGLLIYLVLTPQQAQPRDLLAALLWPDEPERVAKQNLRQSLHRLRQLLGDSEETERPLRQAQGKPFLFISRTAVQWNSASSTGLDVADFLTALESKALETAVSLYKGDLLPSFTCDSQPFEEWLQQEREQLQRLTLNALSALAEQNLAKADYKKSETLARQQLALVPWREEAHRQLLQALVMQGERSAAMAQYERCRTILEEELGIEPVAETQALGKAIARQQAETNDSRSAATETRQPRVIIPFVGRQTEFEQLVTTYRRLSDEGLQLITLVGGAGIGKTRLAEQFLLWVATQGADVLHGRAYETSTDLSYQPIIQLFRQRLELENAPEDLLSDLWLAQLTRLWPELRERYPDLPEPTREENIARQHLFEAIARLGLALSERAPLVLFIDDGQWIDTASLDALQYAVSRWSEEQVPILLLLTLRQEALAEFPETQQWLTHLKRHGTSRQLTLNELSEQETNQLIQRVLDADGEDEAALEEKARASLAQFSQWLFAETAGQPLFLTEALKALVDEGLVVHSVSAGVGWQIAWDKLQTQEEPTRVWQGVQEIVRGWLQRLSDPAGSLLAAAAVLVEAASFDHLYQVAGLDEMGAISALDECLNRQMLVEANQGLLAPTHNPIYSFAHQKISDIVYAEAGAARRRILHRRAFAALQASAMPAAELAHHAHRAGLVTETIHYSLKAGNEALAVFSAQVAIHHYQSAFQEAAQRGWPETISGADRQAIYLGLGRAYELSEKAESAEAVYKEMVAYARQIGASAMECIGLNRLAQQYGNALLDPDKAFAALEQARHVAEQAGDQRGLAETFGNLSLAAGNIYDTERERRYAEQALALARKLTHPQLLANCLRRMAYMCTKRREWEKGEQYAAEAQQRLEAIGNLMLANDIQRILGACQMQNGRPQESLETHKKAFFFIQQVENAWEQADVARFLALAYMEVGQYGQAIQLVREAVEKARKVNHPMVTIPLSSYQVIHRAVLALDEAQEAGLIILAAVANGGFDPFPDLTLAELCAIHALRGEWAQAHTYAKEVVAFHTGKSLPPMSTQGWLETEALLRGGDDALARAEVERFAAVVGNNRRYRLPLLRSRAVLAQWDGELGQAISHLQAALALAQEIGLPGEAWPILGELGRLYAEQGEQDRAQQAYEQAGTMIHRLAETIDEDALREGFLTATPVQCILQRGEGV